MVNLVHHAKRSNQRGDRPVHQFLDSYEQLIRSRQGDRPPVGSTFRRETADPHPALQLTQICQASGIHIPEEVAILAGDTDDVICDIADPPPLQYSAGMRTDRRAEREDVAGNS